MQVSTKLSKVMHCAGIYLLRPIYTIFLQYTKKWWQKCYMYVQDIRRRHRRHQRKKMVFWAIAFRCQTVWKCPIATKFNKTTQNKSFQMQWKQTYNIQRWIVSFMIVVVISARFYMQFIVVLVNMSVILMLILCLWLNLHNFGCSLIPMRKFLEYRS